MADDLTTPLGKGKRRRLLPDPAPILAAIAGAVLVAGLAWTVLIDDPLGGEPSAVATIERAQPRSGAGEESAAAPSPLPATPSSPDSAPAAVQTAAEPSAGPLIIKVPQNGAAGAATHQLRGAGAAMLAEDSKYGPVPRIGADGLRPADAFAATTVAEAEDKRPKIAIFLGGLGVSDAMTARVLERLPRTITLGFTPYGDDLNGWIGKARESGYEVMLQVPMEPFDYPTSDPGPQTLLTTLPAPANLDRLMWVMSRASGYFGLANYMGAKFTASEAALAPVLIETARRGLVFLDSGSTRSLVPRIAAETGAIAARAEIVVDAALSTDMIDASLARLEEQARREGAVIGVASAQPVTLDRLEQWAGTLTAKGIALVPVSAVVKRADPS